MVNSVKSEVKYGDSVSLIFIAKTGYRVKG